MAEIVGAGATLGIRKQKCATIAEAEMVAAAGGTDVLLSYPLAGPNLKRFARLVRRYPGTTFGPPSIIPTPPAPCQAAEGLDRPSRSWSTWRSGWAGPASIQANPRPSFTRLSTGSQPGA